jgi:hypothetical protein
MRTTRGYPLLVLPDRGFDRGKRSSLIVKETICEPKERLRIQGVYIPDPMKDAHVTAHIGQVLLYPGYLLYALLPPRLRRAFGRSFGPMIIFVALSRT